MAKATEKRKEELRKWAYQAWQFSWRELAPVSNSRAQFLKYVVRDNFDDEELTRIELSIQAQAKHWRRQNKIAKVIGIPCLSAWYNANRYDDQFIDESASEMIDREQAKTCIVDGCENDVHGMAYKYCSTHIPSAHSDLIERTMKENNIDIKSPTFHDDCRESSRRSLNKMIEKSEAYK